VVACHGAAAPASPLAQARGSMVSGPESGHERSRAHDRESPREDSTPAVHACQSVEASVHAASAAMVVLRRVDIGRTRRGASDLLDGGGGPRIPARSSRSGRCTPQGRVN
jgi:hypothetical protein